MVAGINKNTLVNLMLVPFIQYLVQSQSQWLQYYQRQWLQYYQGQWLQYYNERRLGVKNGLSW